MQLLNSRLETLKIRSANKAFIMEKAKQLGLGLGDFKKDMEPILGNITGIDIDGFLEDIRKKLEIFNADQKIRDEFEKFVIDVIRKERLPQRKKWMKRVKRLVDEYMRERNDFSLWVPRICSV